MVGASNSMTKNQPSLVQKLPNSWIKGLLWSQLLQREIFLKLKKHGIDYRMILNLKELNKFVAYQHFKMDSLKCVTSLMTQGCYMASVDTRDAYYTVPVALEHQKYLKFTWKDKLYQYTCLPNGLASAPRIFTKHLKTVFKILRQKRPFIFVIHENK